MFIYKSTLSVIFIWIMNNESNIKYTREKYTREKALAGEGQRKKERIPSKLQAVSTEPNIGLKTQTVRS